MWACLGKLLSDWRRELEKTQNFQGCLALIAVVGVEIAE